jgi:site-specific DNA-methyltransferase (adenine-specific)
VLNYAEKKAGASANVLVEQFQLSDKGNNHPTVKPIELMKYLIKLVTPPGGKVLDPFNGSGSTGCAAVELGCEYVGIELDAKYVDIARKRIAAWNKEATAFKELFE